MFIKLDLVSKAVADTNLAGGRERLSMVDGKPKIMYIILDSIFKV